METVDLSVADIFEVSVDVVIKAKKRHNIRDSFSLHAGITQYGAANYPFAFHIEPDRSPKAREHKICAPWKVRIGRGKYKIVPVVYCLLTATYWYSNNKPAFLETCAVCEFLVEILNAGDRVPGATVVCRGQRPNEASRKRRMYYTRTG